jgi:hypothetical protein
MALYKLTRHCMTEVSSWHPIATAPYDCDLELAVVEGNDAHALVFRCRRARSGWVNATTGQRLNIDPTHWRQWHAHSPD